MMKQKFNKLSGFDEIFIQVISEVACLMMLN